MKLMHLFLISMLAIALLIPIVSATTTTYVGASMGATMKSFVSLGIENIPGIATEKVKAMYNWISVGFIFLIGAMSSKRMTRFFGLLVPVFAAVFVMIGWLVGPNPAATYSIILMCGILGVVSYMKGSLRENFGGGGPGSLIINLVFYLIILQACVGLVNATGMWTNGNVADANALDNTYAPNAVLTQSIPTLSNSGGLLSDAFGAGSILLQLAVSSVVMLVQIMLSVALFSATINSIYPWIGANTLGALFLVALQLGIWFLYVLFFVNVMSKTYPDTTAF